MVHQPSLIWTVLELRDTFRKVEDREKSKDPLLLADGIRIQGIGEVHQQALKLPSYRETYQGANQLAIKSHDH